MQCSNPRPTMFYMNILSLKICFCHVTYHFKSVPWKIVRGSWLFEIYLNKNLAIKFSSWTNIFYDQLHVPLHPSMHSTLDRSPKLIHLANIKYGHCPFKQNPLYHGQVAISIKVMHFADFSCDKAAVWMVQSLRLSVYPSVCLPFTPYVCHTFWAKVLSSCHHEILRSNYHWRTWCPCKKSRSEINGQDHRGQKSFSRFRAVTPGCTHIWWWNDAHTLKWIMRGALLFFQGHPSNFKVTRNEKYRVEHFRTVGPVWIHWWIQHDAHYSLEEEPYCLFVKFPGHMD